MLSLLMISIYYLLPEGYSKELPELINNALPNLLRIQSSLSNSSPDVSHTPDT